MRSEINTTEKYTGMSARSLNVYMKKILSMENKSHLPGDMEVTMWKIPYHVTKRTMKWKAPHHGKKHTRNHFLSQIILK